VSYLQVRNWDVWQSYRKDRGAPPWIKIHRSLMSNPEWAILTDSEKGQLISLWIVAADSQGKLKSDSRILRKICMLDDEPNLSKFIELGFLEEIGCQDDVNVTPNTGQDDVPEQRRGEKNIRSNAVAFADFWVKWPKKVKRKEAERAWNRLTIQNQKLAMADFPIRYAETDPQFIPYPTTYIHGERWTDELNSQSEPSYGAGGI